MSCPATAQQALTPQSATTHILHPAALRYTEYVVKGEMVNTLCGFPIEHTGGHIAIRHDARIHMENMERRNLPCLRGVVPGWLAQKRGLCSCLAGSPKSAA